MSSPSGSVETRFDQLIGALRPLELLAVTPEGVRKRAANAGRVFVVHGHNLDLRDKVAAWLKTVSLTPIILAKQPGSSKTVIELIEEHRGVEHAICLLTADDLGGVDIGSLRARARQNVVLEVGDFFALLGRKNVSVLADSSVELPSDILGLRPIILHPGINLERRLQDDLEHCGVLTPK